MSKPVYSDLDASQRGFTIVEIMVAMLLGLILMAGVVSLMIGNKRSFNEQTEMSRLQENARFAIEFLTRDIRMAGYVGCSHDIAKVTNHLNQGAEDLLYVDNAIEGANDVVPGSAPPSNSKWKPSDSIDNVADMVAGTDAITIRFFRPTGHSLQSAMSAVSDDIAATAVDGIGGNAVLAVSDCASADIFQVTGITGSNIERAAVSPAPLPGNSTTDLSKLYDNSARLHHLYAARYHIRQNPDNIPALYRYVHSGTGYRAQELVAGIEDMQIMYGDGTTFAAAVDVVNWENVNSVQIGLLVRTEDEMGVDVDNRAYNVLNKTVPAAGDRHRRKVFTTTIELRNRS